MENTEVVKKDDAVSQKMRDGTLSHIERNHYADDKEQYYNNEQKAYHGINNIRQIYQGAIQLGLTKLAAQLKDAQSPEEIEQIIYRIKELANTEDIKNLTTASSKTLSNMKSMYAQVPNTVVIQDGGGLLKKLFGDL